MTTEATLQSMISDLDGYITRRAEELAAPMVAEARAEADGRVRAAERETDRASSLAGELKRRVAELARRQEESAAARDKLAAALGHHPAGQWLPQLADEAVAVITSARAGDPA